MWGRASSTGRSSLAERRRRRRRRLLIAAACLLLLLIAAAIYGLRQPAVRISRVIIAGTDPLPTNLATAAMRGSYLGVIPRDSIFFYPASDIRAAILAAHPEIAALSIFRTGLVSISIKVDMRVPVARWCGPASDAARLNLGDSDVRFNLAASSTPTANCYFFDANGFIYATATDAAAPINAFAVYKPFADASAAPLGSTLSHAERFPAAFGFARRLASLGSPVSVVVIRDDEVDDRLAGGTLVIYLLGGEQDAYAALVSAKTSLNLADGSIDYVDLRFPGKVYVKRR